MRAAKLRLRGSIRRGNRSIIRAVESDWRSKVSELDPVEKVGGFCGPCSKPPALPVHPWSKQRGFKRGQSVDA
jgi:hypothetical protein